MTLILIVVGIIGIAILVTVTLIKQVPKLIDWFVLRNKQATYVRQGAMKLVAAGGKLRRVLENIPDWYYEQGEHTYITRVGEEQPDGKWMLVDKPIQVRRAIVRSHEKPPTTLWDWKNVAEAKNEGIFYVFSRWFRYKLRTHMGIYWVSILYPNRHLHSFSITKKRLKDRAAGRDVSLEERWIQYEKEPVEVDDLLWQFPRPIIMTDVDFTGILKADLAIQTLFQVVIPEIPVFTYEGRFFPLIESVVQGAISDYCRSTGLTLRDFINKNPTGQGSDFFARVVSQINIGRGNSSKGLIEQFGIEVIGSWIVEIDPKDDDAKDALKKAELAALAGDADIMKEQKAAVALLAKTNGEAKALGIRADADANATRVREAAKTEQLKLRKEQVGENVTIAELKINQYGALGGDMKTLVESGANASLLVGTDNGQSSGAPSKIPAQKSEPLAKTNP